MNFTLLSKLRSYVQVSICISVQSHTPEANSCCAWSDATPSTRSPGHRVGNGGTKAMGGKRGRWEWGCESRAVGELSRSAAGYCMQHMQESLPECPQREPFQTVLSPYDTKGGWVLGGGLRFPSVLRWTANFPHSSQPHSIPGHMEHSYCSSVPQNPPARSCATRDGAAQGSLPSSSPFPSSKTVLLFSWLVSLMLKSHCRDLKYLPRLLCRALLDGKHPTPTHHARLLLQKVWQTSAIPS